MATEPWMTDSNIYISHNSALHFWRTNPPWYVIEGADRNIRTLRNCPASDETVRSFCLSEAEFGPKPFDALLPEDGPKIRSFLRFHVQKAPLPAHSLYPIRDGIHVVSPALCFVQLCNSLSIVEALELGMEFCGTYALRPDSPGDKSTRTYRLMDASTLARKLNSWKSIHGVRQARRIAPLLANGSASPMETKLFLMLTLPQKHGGYNIEKPELNPEIELPHEARLILRQDKVKPDMLWQDAKRNLKLVVEYDGEYHNDPAQARKDEMRRAVLETMGYTVVAVKKHLIYNPMAFDGLAKMIAKKCGKRLRPLTGKQQLSRELLRAGLLSTTR